jgi:putative acetyltransferase
MKQRLATTADFPAIKKLFLETVHHVCLGDYSPAEIAAWTSGVEEEPERWLKKIEEQHFILIEIDGVLVGMGSLLHGDYLDMMYVHKDYQGQGIAKRLLSELEAEAIRQGNSRISSDVSITARPFFDKKGFKVLHKNEIPRKGIILINYHVEKMVPGS